MIPHHTPECYGAPCSPSCPVRARIEELVDRLQVTEVRAAMWCDSNDAFDQAMKRAERAESAIAAMTDERDKWKADTETMAKAGIEVRAQRDRRDREAVEWCERARKAESELARLRASEPEWARLVSAQLIHIGNQSEGDLRRIEIEARMTKESASKVFAELQEIMYARNQEPEQCDGSGLFICYNGEFCPVCGAQCGVTPGQHVKPHTKRRP